MERRDLAPAITPAAGDQNFSIKLSYGGTHGVCKTRVDRLRVDLFYLFVCLKQNQNLQTMITLLVAEITLFGGGVNVDV